MEPVEFGETVEDDVKRELKEELSVEAGMVALLGATDHILPQEGVHWVSPVFLAVISSPARPRTSREMSTATCAGSAA